MKRILMILLAMVFVLGGCGSKDEPAVENQETTQTNVEQQVVDEQSKNNKKSTIVECGEIYSTGELSYNIIGVQVNSYSGGEARMLLNLEIFNETSEDVAFTPFDRLTLFGESGEEYSVNLLADVETGLGNQIPSDSKIMGDVAFDITDSADDVYILHVGKEFEYEPAIRVTEDQVGHEFAEQFETHGVQTAYTIGTPVESEQLTILLKSANIEASDKEAMEQLNCVLEVTNNTSESQNFMLGFNLVGAYTEGGQTLEDRGAEITLPTVIEPGETISGVVPYYIPEGERAFYIATKPNLHNFSEIVNIAFEVE